VTSSSVTAAPGATVSLTATVSAGDPDDLAWAVYPVGAGTVVADPDDASKATYTAPEPTGTNPQASVVAYLADDEAAGFGLASIQISSLMAGSVSTGARSPRGFLCDTVAAISSKCVGASRQPREEVGQSAQSDDSPSRAD
jgi:hypothetical protein